jgi:hypothetical protein
VALDAGKCDDGPLRLRIAWQIKLFHHAPSFRQKVSERIVSDFLYFLLPFGFYCEENPGTY